MCRSEAECQGHHSWPRDVCWDPGWKFRGSCSWRRTCAQCGRFYSVRGTCLSVTTVIILIFCLLTASVFDQLVWLEYLGCVCHLTQVHKRKTEKWKDMDAATRSLQLCMISNLLKLECCGSATHSMDDVSLEASGLYKTLPGLDCTFPGFVLQQCKHTVQQLKDTML